MVYQILYRPFPAESDALAHLHLTQIQSWEIINASGEDHRHLHTLKQQKDANAGLTRHSATSARLIVIEMA